MTLKRGLTVKILRKESYWFQETGKIASIDESKVLYGVTIRFDKVNYNGINTATFNFLEVKVVN